MRSTVVLARVALCVTAGSVAVGMFSGTASAQSPRPADNVVCDLTTQLQLPLLCGLPVPGVPSGPTLPIPAVPVPALPVPALPVPAPADPTGGDLLDGGVLDEGVIDDVLGEGGVVDELLGDEGVVDEFLNGSPTGGNGATGGNTLVGDGGVIGNGGVIDGAVDHLLGEGGTVDELLTGGGILVAVVEADTLDEGGTVDDVLCTVSQVLGVTGSTCPANAAQSNPVNTVVSVLTNILPATNGTTPGAAGVRSTGTDSGGSSLPVTGAGGVVAMLGIGGILSAVGVLARRSMRLPVG